MGILIVVNDLQVSWVKICLQQLVKPSLKVELKDSNIVRISLFDLL